MSWKTLLFKLFSLVGPKLGVTAALAMLKWLPFWRNLPDETVPTVGSPDELKTLIKKYLTDLIASAGLPTFVNTLLTRVLDAVTDAAIDRLWDWLFAAQRVDKPLTAFGRAATFETPAAASADTNELEAAAVVELTADAP